MAANSSLCNKTIIVTQQADHAGDLILLLKEKGAKVINIPLIETSINKIELNQEGYFKNLTCFNFLIFTSRMGVKGFFENLERINGEIKIPEGLKIAAIGKGTAREIEKMGFNCDYLNPGRDVRDFVLYLKSEVIKGGETLLFLLGDMASSFLEDELSSVTNIVRINVYSTILNGKCNSATTKYFVSGEADICIFTSPSGFRSLLVHHKPAKNICLAAIGNTTAAFIRKMGFDVEVVAQTPAPVAIVEALEEYFSAKR